MRSPRRSPVEAVNRYDSVGPPLRGFFIAWRTRMLKRDKERIVAELADRLRSAQSLIVTDYRGLSVKEIDDLRTKLLEHGVRYTVVKNTLTRLAAEQAEEKDLLELLDGPTAIAFLESDADPAAAAKVLNEIAGTGSARHPWRPARGQDDHRGRRQEPRLAAAHRRPTRAARGRPRRADGHDRRSVHGPAPRPRRRHRRPHQAARGAGRDSARARTAGRSAGRGPSRGRRSPGREPKQRTEKLTEPEAIRTAEPEPERQNPHPRRNRRKQEEE